MRALTFVVLAAACDAGAPATGTPATTTTGTPATTTTTTSTASTAAPRKPTIAIPLDHPTSGILIDIECSLSPHPPSTYFYSSRTTYDLAAATWRNHHVEGNETTHARRPGSEEAPKTKDTHGTLTLEQVRVIHGQLAAVLGGGPYEPVYPPSGGGRCTLELYVKGHKPFFTIDRADNNLDDEVTRLMKGR